VDILKNVKYLSELRAVKVGKLGGGKLSLVVMMMMMITR